MSHPLIARRRLLQGSLGVGALAALGLAGCSNEGRGDTGSQAENDAVELPAYIPYEGFVPDLKGENGVSDTVLQYPMNPVAATAGPPGDGADVGVFALTNAPVPPPMSQNVFWQELNDRLGFTLSVALVPSGDFTERFQTTVAGDQLPDLFTYFPGGVPGLPALLRERAADLTDLLSGDAVQDYPFLANIPTESWRAAVYGGRIYGVPIARGAQSSPALYRRDDVLAAQGIDGDVQSWDDLLAIFRELTGGNTWALSNVPMQLIRQAHGIANAWEVGADGGLVSVNEDERQLEALEQGRRLVADGLVHPDTTTSDNQQRQAWVVGGTTMFFEGTFAAWPNLANLPTAGDMRLGVVVPPAIEGGGVADVWLGPPTHNLTGISIDSTDRAAALLDVLNYLAAPFGSAEHIFKNYGLEGVHHNLVDGDPVLTDKGQSETQLGLKYIGEGPWVNYVPGKPDVAQAQFDAQSAVVPTAIPNPASTLFSETQSRKGSQIGSALGSVETDILQGREPVSAWTEAVERWKRDGGDQIRDELSEAYAESEG
ncbi:extracellular solute-binding protein [Occultella glacieicola]|uniref:Extracellular solute-binding protein n=1 Tax=Occultella glacieicola TaxID=2518684 RepID=A0ABY2E0T6_9MICO|nr:extracellular solute-binding protein [Occultella glacieicola]TDE91536.1 extracellular solute-binding protein [Occultella glacieicola]